MKYRHYIKNVSPKILFLLLLILSVPIIVIPILLIFLLPAFHKQRISNRNLTLLLFKKKFSYLGITPSLSVPLYPCAKVVHCIHKESEVKISFVYLYLDSGGKMRRNIENIILTQENYGTSFYSLQKETCNSIEIQEGDIIFISKVTEPKNPLKERVNLVTSWEHYAVTFLN